MQPAVIRHFVETMEDRARTLKELAVVLDEVGSGHALVGGLAVGYHGRERATIDVDLLVSRAKLNRIQQALEARGFRVTKSPDMLRVFPHDADPEHGEAIADLVAYEANPVLQAAFGAIEEAQILGQPVRVVQRGALVALKFHAAVSQHRKLADRYQDIADIGRILAKGFSDDDAAAARRIAGLSYPGAERDFDQLITDFRAGRPVKI